jgi:uncharacterized protein (TIGR02246 family)
MIAKSDDAAQACLARIKSAWDAGDAPAYAAEFTEDATYVIFLGEALFGRHEIEATHRDVFEKWQRGTKMAVRPLSVRIIANDAVSILTIGGLGNAEPIHYDKFQTFTFVRRGDRWACSAFQNTRMNANAEAAFNRSRDREQNPL